jgi:general secretion pathway protein G
MHLKSPVAITRRSASRAVRAFTILEILVVIAIAGMLIGLVVARLEGVFNSSKLDIASMFVKSSIKIPLQQYCMHMGDYPSTADGIQVLLTAPTNKADRWRGPYLSENKIPLDPWGEPYQYRYPGTKNKQGYDVWSKGPDKQDGTEDDIGNW